MKLGHLTCILLQIVCFLPNISYVNAQNQQMYIRTDAIAHKEDKTAPERRTTSTLSDINPPITNIHKDSVKIGDSTPISVNVGTPQIVRDAKTQANEAHLTGIVTYRAVVSVQPSAVLQISPNPVSDVATMTITYEGVPIEADCYLTDLAGKVLWQKQIQISNKLTLESLTINELPKGIYLMRVQIGTTFLIQKMVKL
jgi:hypothetical protein